MADQNLHNAALTVFPLTPERWSDLETLFGTRGACGGCWCMFWRLKNKDFKLMAGEPAKSALQGLVDSGLVPGLIAYEHENPVGWISFGPREDFVRLENSRVLARVDDQPVWSIVCFFIHRKERRKGISTALIKAALAYARANGAKIVEAYPVVPNRPDYPDVYAYTGLYSTFTKLGFVESARRSEKRAVVRYVFEE